MQNIEKALKSSGIQKGDTVLFHSSLKSLGWVDGGPTTVINAFCNVVSKNGTVIVPTFCQKDFDNAYKTWYIEKPSDTGCITEALRKMPGALRSNQATHSVAAIGKNADFYTRTHGERGRRPGIYGDTPFSHDSPWQKMYDNNIWVILLGVGFESYTFKHFFEYMLVEKRLNLAKEKGEYNKYYERLCSFNTRAERGEKYIWPYIPNDKILDFAKKTHFITYTTCQNVKLTAFRAKDFGKPMYEDILNNTEKWFNYDENVLAWLAERKEK